MRRLLILALTASGSFGCLAYPHAQLSLTEGLQQQVKAPVVCGPMGFRKVPLQARWGEYVRVTVSSAVPLRGVALLHANGQTHEPRAWSTERDGSLVLETRFENLDPDARFALTSERPIDITLTELEAPAGGSCEGAIFTVEQGALVPSIAEAAWVLELERRGGPELAARRAAARAEMEARREAHYAAWAQRQQVEVSAEVLAQADTIRLEHYAAWDARHGVQVEARLDAPATEVAVGGATEVTGSAGASAAVMVGGDAHASSSSVQTAGGRCGVAVSGGASAPMASCTGPGCVVAAPPTSCMELGGGAGAVTTTTTTETSGGGFAVGGVMSTTTVDSSSGVAGGGSMSNTSGGGAVGGVTSTTTVVDTSGGIAAGGTMSTTTVDTSGGISAGGTMSTTTVDTGGGIAAGGTMSTTTVDTSGSITAGGTITVEGATTSTQVGADVVASAPSEWSSFQADTSWAQPADAQLRVTATSEWQQPYEARLDSVAVSTESRVAVGSAPPVVQASPAPVAPSCAGGCGADVSFAMALPAVFQVLANAAMFVPAPPPPPPQRVIRAVPVGATR